MRSAGAEALSALLKALDWEIEATLPGQGSGTLRAVRRAVRDALKAIEGADWEEDDDD